jgi:hypothetical protein
MKKLRPGEKIIADGITFRGPPTMPPPPLARPAASSPDVETATIKIRVSREVLEWLARRLNATFDLGAPDADGFHEPSFTVKPQ